MWNPVKKRLNEILAEGSRMLNRTCFRAWSPCGCWNSETFHIQVTTEITLVTGLTSRGNFEVMFQSPPLASTELLPEDPSVGLDSVFETAWSFIEEDTAGIMGMYGVGGVGKTTLLEKINNKFLNESHGFDVVMWAVISNDVNLRGIQNQIGRSLGLSWQENESVISCARHIFKWLRNKQFVVLLDDIWEQLDLSSIGIPHPKDPNSRRKCKVVFTTRSYTVCGEMGADKKIKVECLDWHKAWELFRNNVRQNTLLDSDPEIRTLAECVAKECDGLPLALIVTGRTMASKKTVGEWNHAVTTLRKHATKFLGMGDKVFPLLKFSYDNLPNDSVRSCLLFCSLYPDDHWIPIEALIQQWIGEGYIDGFDEWKEAICMGHAKIGILKATCLLQSAGDEYVKMHDAIRDLAHWIACDYGKNKDKILLKDGSELMEGHEAGKWVMAHTISLWKTGIPPPDDIPECSHLSTLLFLKPEFQFIPETVFLSMPNLRVLEISSITGRAVKGLPRSIGNLVKLEYLDLSGTRFEQKLPVEMKNLVSLKYLFLGHYNKVPVGVIKNLLNLRTLKLNTSNFGDWKEGDRLAGIQELEYLRQLICLQIEISNIKEIQCFLSKDCLVSSIWDLRIRSLGNDKIRSLTLSPSLYSSSCLNLGGMKNMRSLEISSCKGLKKLVIDNCREIALFKSLETLTISVLPLLTVSWDDRKNHNGPCFRNLHSIVINMCDSFVNLNWLRLAPRLQFLDVSTCFRVEGIFLEEDSVACDENTFSSLKQLKLRSLPVLKSIYSYALRFPSLKEIEIYHCPQLKCLPLDSNSAQNTLQFIDGTSKWWNDLEWKDESVKSTFTSFFRGFV